MKYRVLEVLFGLVFLVGLYLFAHDTVADQLNNLRQDRTLSDYQEAVSEASPETYEAEMQAALAHNAAITENTFAGDLFAGEGVQADDEYNALLNLNGDGVMGMISIPKINQTIPIYHGTDDSVLQVGAGHLPGTALPVGGENTHCVLAAHRGLPSARLFSDIDQLEEGDMIYLHILGEVHAYRVENILPMVPKDDFETLNKALRILHGQDWLSLMTCTPYGINTHRLLVRGHRVNTRESQKHVRVTADATRIDPIITAPVIALPMLAVLLIWLLVTTRKRPKAGKHEKMTRGDPHETNS